MKDIISGDNICSGSITIPHTSTTFYDDYCDCDICPNCGKRRRPRIIQPYRPKYIQQC